MRTGIIFPIAILLFFSSCYKTRIKEHNEWAKYFKDQGINNACFMMFDNNHESVHYYNQAQCQRRFVPASTFNLFNSMVALETGIAPNDQLTIAWDSVPRQNPEWNKDLTLRSAVTVHAVPFFQELARRIGPFRMQHYLDTVKYGNMTIGPNLDRFWMDNTLMISADEQVGLIKKLYFNELPFSEGAQRLVRSMMVQEDSGAFKLHYYTGTADTKTGDSTVRWLIGYVEKIETVKEPKGSLNPTNVHTYPYFFAQNFILPKADTSKDWSKVRLVILHNILRDYGATSMPL
jgi:beta-lactamase class D